MNINKVYYLPLIFVFAFQTTFSQNNTKSQKLTKNGEVSLMNYHT